MKTSRAVSVAGLSAALVATGWATGTGFLTPAHSAEAAPATSPTTSDTASSTPVTTTSEPAAASSTPSPTPTATATETTAGAPSGTFDGDTVNTRYGAFQVEITVTDGKITDLTLLQEGQNDHRSQQINSYAIPRLTKEVLSAQSASVQAISGASFTSAGFLESAASAIQAAGL